MLVGACASGPSGPTSVPPAVKAELAPTGTLRAAINFGNTVLAQRDADGGGARGVSVALSEFKTGTPEDTA